MFARLALHLVSNVKEKIQAVHSAKKATIYSTVSASKNVLLCIFLKKKQNNVLDVWGYARNAKAILIVQPALLILFFILMMPKTMANVFLNAHCNFSIVLKITEALQGGSVSHADLTVSLAKMKLLAFFA